MTVTSGALPKIKTTLSLRIFEAYKKLTCATYEPTLVSRSNMLLQSQKQINVEVQHDGNIKKLCGLQDMIEFKKMNHD